jgi:hypothetical protein
MFKRTKEEQKKKRNRTKDNKRKPRKNTGRTLINNT